MHRSYLKKRQVGSLQRQVAFLYFLCTDIVIKLDERSHAVPQEDGNMPWKVAELLQDFRTRYRQQYEVNPPLLGASPEEGSVISSLIGEIGEV